MEKMELIELGLNEVARECRIIERVATESRFCIELMEAKGKPADSVYHDMANEHEAMLNDVHQKVVELLEFVGEYMNGHDMVGAVDVAINKTIYDLVYERTDETSYDRDDHTPEDRLMKAIFGDEYEKEPKPKEADIIFNNALDLLADYTEGDPSDLCLLVDKNEPGWCDKCKCVGGPINKTCLVKALKYYKKDES